MVQNNKVLIFAGAGLSTESGIPTFRDAGGLWNEYDIDVVCNIATIDNCRKEVFEFYNKLKSQYLKVEPNDAHYALADLQSYYGPNKVKIFTSNVDMLLEEAGCSNVVHVHGDCEHSQCLNCGGSFYIGDNDFDSKACPYCDGGKSYLKPGIVFFGEKAPKYNDLDEDFRSHFYEDQKTGLLEPKMKVIIGTSFQVIPEYCFHLEGSMDNCLLVDPNPNEMASYYFKNIIKGAAAKNSEVFSDFIKARVPK